MSTETQEKKDLMAQLVEQVEDISIFDAKMEIEPLIQNLRRLLGRGTLTREFVTDRERPTLADVLTLLEDQAVIARARDLADQRHQRIIDHLMEMARGT